MSFADQLKQERERLGITQAQAASLIEVPARTYWEWEAEKTTPYAITQEGALERLRITIAPAWGSNSQTNVKALAPASKGESK